MKTKLLEQLNYFTKAHEELDKKIKLGYSNYLSDRGLIKIKQERTMISNHINYLKQQLKGTQ